MNREERSGRALAGTRIRRAAVWDAVQFAGNGVIFVLLGLQLPEIAASAQGVAAGTGHHASAWLLVYILAITAALLLFRFLWAWATLRFRHVRIDGRADLGFIRRMSAVAALAGVRGAVTLSAIMALPLTLPNGDIFPARQLSILLAAGVIVASLIVAAVGLPLLLRGARPEAEVAPHPETNAIRRAAAEAAIRAVEGALPARGDGPAADQAMRAAARVITSYQHAIEAASGDGASDTGPSGAPDVERALRLIALRAERGEVYRRAGLHALPDTLVRALVRDIDLREEQVCAREAGSVARGASP